MTGMIVIFYSANAFAELEDIFEVLDPNVFVKEDYMVLDKQNYSDGDVVKMSGFIEGKGGHVLTIIIVNPSEELKSAGHSYGPNDSFGIETRIMPISWEDGIYKIVASSVGKEFVEVFGVNYVLTETDIVKYQQEQEKKKIIKYSKNLLGNHVGVRTDMSNYTQGGMLKIYGYGHSVDDGETSPDESITLKIYVKNSQIPIHKAEVDLDENGEFSYYLDTSDNAKWDYTTRTNLPFGTPHGFYNVVAEFAETKYEREFILKATTEQGKETNEKTEQLKPLQQDEEHKTAKDSTIIANDNIREMSLEESTGEYPAINSREFCDWYYEEMPSDVQANRIMKEEILKNPLTSYFLSKSADPTYRILAQEDSFPPRMHSIHQYTTNNVTASLEYFFVPCHYFPEPSEFIFQTKADDVDINALNFFEEYASNISDSVEIIVKRIENQHTGITNDYIEISVSSSYDNNSREITNKEIMNETIHDSMLFLTHEKWLNQKNQIVYISPESVEILIERGYLTEKLDFFK